MYPTGPIEEDPEIYRRYLLSHGSYKPGEQKRHYGKSWTPPEVKEVTDRKKLGNDGNRVQAALHWNETAPKYSSIT
jgi:hypothetical protein